MSKLSISDVEHIARLSKLELREVEKEKFSKQLSDVLQYVDQLNEVKTEDLEATSQITGLSNVVSSDEISKSDVSYDQIKVNAPDFSDGSFVVPGVFKQ